MVFERKSGGGVYVIYMCHLTRVFCWQLNILHRVQLYPTTNVSLLFIIPKKFIVLFSFVPLHCQYRLAVLRTHFLD